MQCAAAVHRVDADCGNSTVELMQIISFCLSVLDAVDAEHHNRVDAEHHRFRRVDAENAQVKDLRVDADNMETVR